MKDEKPYPEPEVPLVWLLVCCQRCGSYAHHLTRRPLARAHCGRCGARGTLVPEEDTP